MIEIGEFVVVVNCFFYFMVGVSVIEVGFVGYSYLGIDLFEFLCYFFEIGFGFFLVWIDFECSVEILYCFWFVVFFELEFFVCIEDVGKCGIE